MKKYLVPASLENRITELLKRTPLNGKILTLDSAKELASCVQRLSDFYIENPKGLTPWSEPWAQIATACYFMPVNYLRNQRVIEEGHRWGFFQNLDWVLDFGAGPGTASWALRDFLSEKKLDFPRSHWVETASVPYWFDVFQQGTTTQGKNADSFLAKNQGGRKLGIFSYSLTELEQTPAWWDQLEALMILEPSTQEDGRKLQALREPLMQKGFSIWAPCTHSEGCPLLLNSKKDWCHDRIFFEAPLWFKKMESFLPWNNNTLTLSYLLLRKSQRPVSETRQARVIGNTREEKIKSRQMMCADQNRIFLTWMKKEGEAEFIPRGSLLDWPSEGVMVSNELRVQGSLTWK